MVLIRDDNQAVSLQSKIFSAETMFGPHDLPGMENVITRQFLGSCDHLFPTDDADVIGGLQIFRSSIRIAEQNKQKLQPMSFVLYNILTMPE